LIETMNSENWPAHHGAAFHFHRAPRPLEISTRTERTTPSVRRDSSRRGHKPA
jgi:hypothetical protein